MLREYPNQKKLKELFYYREDGKLIRKTKPSKRIDIGDIAGSINKKDGYCKVIIEGVSYLSHRLIWILVKGYNPENDVDHINRNRSDNRMKNLRVVSHSCNMRNRPMLKNNTSGISGVMRCNRRPMWISRITVNKKVIELGKYKSIIIAAMVRWSAEVCYKFPECNSTSSAYLYLKEKNIIKKENT